MIEPSDRNGPICLRVAFAFPRETSPIINHQSTIALALDPGLSTLSSSVNPQFLAARQSHVRSPDLRLANNQKLIANSFSRRN